MITWCVCVRLPATSCWMINGITSLNRIWLVVEPPLQKNMSFSVGIMKFPTEWKNNPNVPNHQTRYEKHLYSIHAGLSYQPAELANIFRRLANWGGEASLNCLLIKIWLTNAGKNLIFLRTQHPWLCLSLEKHQGHSEWMDSPATHPIPTTEILNCFNVSVQLIDIGQQTWARDF